jgi:pimeloyl-ACP methyl ester carboxylesterase
MFKTVMLIHGAWLTPASWNLFARRYEARGYTVVAPPWPLTDRPIEELRRSPHAEFGHLTIARIVEHYAQLLRTLPSPTIVIGHSYGGLFTQLLLERGLGAAGVALDPAPIRGVTPTPQAFLSALPAFMAWRGWNRALTMRFEDFATNFAQTLSEPEKRVAYDQYVVPAPGRLYYQAAFGIGTSIQPNNAKRASLLLVAGEQDRIIAPSMVQATYHKQRQAPSTTAFKSFPGRSHFLIAEPGWEEVADYAIEWATAHARLDLGGRLSETHARDERLTGQVSEGVPVHSVPGDRGAPTHIR